MFEKLTSCPLSRTQFVSVCHCFIKTNCACYDSFCWQIHDTMLVFFTLRYTHLKTLLWQTFCPTIFSGPKFSGSNHFLDQNFLVIKNLNNIIFWIKISSDQNVFGTTFFLKKIYLDQKSFDGSLIKFFLTINFF